MISRWFARQIQSIQPLWTLELDHLQERGIAQRLWVSGRSFWLYCEVLRFGRPWCAWAWLWFNPIRHRRRLAGSLAGCALVFGCFFAFAEATGMRCSGDETGPLDVKWDSK